MESWLLPWMYESGFMGVESENPLVQGDSPDEPRTQGAS